jgi:hypothetical protein
LAISKPEFAQFHEWDEWEANLKKERPMAFWLTETLPDWLDNVWKFITDPYYNTRSYIRNRFVDHTHILHTRLPAGGWYDVDHRLLHGIMETLVDFIEVEKAWMFLLWSKPEDKQVYEWKNGRCPEAGLAYLKWEMTLDEQDEDGAKYINRPQSDAAREQLAIYNWWKFERPARPDVYDVTGWSEYCDRHKGFCFDNRSEEDRQESRRILDAVHELEAKYESEDEDMLIRVIKIRHSLWT